MSSPPATPDHQHRAGHTRSGASFSPTVGTPQHGRAKRDSRESSLEHREKEKKRKAAPSRQRPKTTKKKTSKALSNDTSPASGTPATKRQANYSEDEDYLIACAYVNVSVDPIRGVGQKSDTFWTRVLEKYVLLSEKYLSDNGVEIPVRNKESIEQRWKKKISKTIQVWNKFYKQVKSVPRSGWNEDDYIAEAGNLYREEVGEPFKCAKCVPIVHKLPKFDPMLSNVARLSTGNPDDDSDADTTSDLVRKDAAKKKETNAAPAQGSNLARPVGMKKAKKLAKLEQSAMKQRANVSPLPGPTSSTAASASAAALLQDKSEMLGVTKELVAVFRASTMLKTKDLNARQEERWMRMAEMYMAAGEKEKALATLAKIEESTSASGAGMPYAINVAREDNLKDAVSDANSISASAGDVPLAVGAAGSENEQSEESDESDYESALEKDCDNAAQV